MPQTVLLRAHDPVYAVRMVFPSPPRRGSIVVQIKFAATFSESVVPSKSGVLGVGTKQEKNPGHRAGRPAPLPRRLSRTRGLLC